MPLPRPNASKCPCLRGINSGRIGLMPYINLRVVGKPKNATYLVIDEVERGNWAQGEKFF